LDEKKFKHLGDQMDEKEYIDIKRVLKPFSEVTQFHGHVCPGSAIGYKAAEAGLNELKSSRSHDEEIIAVVENDSCAVDAVQVLTGCTFGKGNLLFKDHGKQVYTFINRKTKDAVRVSLNDSFSVDTLAPQLAKLRANVNSGIATELEKSDLKQMIVEVSEEILEIPYNEMFHIEHVEVDLPEKATIFPTVKCSKCGEMVSKHRSKIKNGEIICIPCFGELD
jgi:formylmethanofuran dehydrogenase subunit E